MIRQDTIITMMIVRLHLFSQLTALASKLSILISAAKGLVYNEMYCCTNIRYINNAHVEEALCHFTVQKAMFNLTMFCFSEYCFSVIIYL